MAVDTAELEIESEKHLNDDEDEFQNGKRFVKACAINSDGTEFPFSDTNVLSPTTATNRSLESQMITNDVEDKETPFIDSNSNSQVFEAENEDEQPQAAKQTSSVSVPNSEINRSHMQQKKRMRILSSQGNYENNVNTFEQAFSLHRYAGSFRLRFCRDESISHENRAQINNPDTTDQSLESWIMTNDDNKTYSADSDSQRSQAFVRFDVEAEDEQPQVDLLEQPTSEPNSRSQRQKEMKILSSQGNYESDVDTFEEAFSKHKHAGSFRLRFSCKDELVAQENRAHDEISIHEFSEPTTSPCKQMVKSNNESKESEMEHEKGPTKFNEELTDIYTNEVAVLEDTSPR